MIKISIKNTKDDSVNEVELSEITLSATKLIIGRLPENPIHLNNPAVSRKHAHITLVNDQLEYTDLESLGGSYLEDEKLEANEAYRLTQGDAIKIGPFLLTITQLILEKAQAQFDIESDKATIISGLNVNCIQPIAYVSESAWQYWKQGEITVTCNRIFQETPDVKTFVFTGSPQILFKYKPGQFALFHLTINGKEYTRSYNFSSTPSRPHSISFTIKRAVITKTSSGIVSNWLHNHLKEGDDITLSGPFGELTCHDHPHEKICLLSTGSGITPMLSMTKWLCDTESWVDIIFFHFANTEEDFIAKEELLYLSKHHENLHLFFSQAEEKPNSSWYGLRGQLTDKMLNLAVPD